MTDASTGASMDLRDHPRRCAAHSSRTGKPCRKWAIRGGSVCATHGGSLKAVKHKAKERLEAAADRMAKELLGIALGAESEAVKLAAIRDALDRSIGKAPTTVEIGPPKPFEQIFDAIAGNSREESRAPPRLRRAADGRGRSCPAPGGPGHARATGYRAVTPELHCTAMLFDRPSRGKRMLSARTPLIRL